MYRGMSVCLYAYKLFVCPYIDIYINAGKIWGRTCMHSTVPSVDQFHFPLAH